MSRSRWCDTAPASRRIGRFHLAVVVRRNCHDSKERRRIVRAVGSAQWRRASWWMRVHRVRDADRQHRGKRAGRREATMTPGALLKRQPVQERRVACLCRAFRRSREKSHGHLPMVLRRCSKWMWMRAKSGDGRRCSNLFGRRRLTGWMHTEKERKENKKLLPFLKLQTLGFSSGRIERPTSELNHEEGAEMVTWQERYLGKEGTTEPAHPLSQSAYRDTPCKFPHSQPAIATTTLSQSCRREASTPE